MKLFTWIITCLAFSSLWANDVPMDPNYSAMMAAKPDRSVRVNGLQIDRDVFTLDFKQGTFHLMPKITGRDWGALFEGEGEIRINPQTDREKIFMSRFGEKGEMPKVSFKRIYLFFTDDTAAELLAAGPSGPANGGDSLLKRCRRAEMKTIGRNMRIRVLQDLYNGQPKETGVFAGILDGGKLDHALIAVDPLSASKTLPYLRTGEQHQSIFYALDPMQWGIWYLDKARLGSVANYQVSPMTDAIHYEIDTTVDRKKIIGRAEITFKPLKDGVRFIELDLMSRLALKSASISSEDGGEIIACNIVQEVQEGAWDSQGQLGSAIVTETPLNVDQTYKLSLEYDGDDVVFEDGNRHFFVAARTTWYPNLGTFKDRATFDLTFRYPKRFELLSVGNLVDSREEGKLKIDRWESKEPLTVAGFNYGEFNRYEDKDDVSGLEMAVLSFKDTNPEPSQGVMADSLNSARLFKTYFGDLPYSKIRVSQQAAWTFGQAWPTLVFMPNFSFKPSDVQLYQSQLKRADLSSFVQTVGSHELAHQWWGHLVTADSFEDQWIEEGFAEFSALLFLQHTVGWNRAREAWEVHRKDITEPGPGSKISPYQAGPISLGVRLSTSETPGVSQTLIYGKGAFVLHMLRMAMMDHRSKEPDAAFIAMMKDFTTTYGGKSVSTNDFKSVVEKHMNKNMNANGDGTMDWFFNQWVHSTEVPVYQCDIKIQSLGEGMFQLAGSVGQKDVSDNFKAMVPLYAVFDKGRFIKLTDMPFKGSMSRKINTKLRLPEAPKEITVNFNHDLLARSED